MSNAIPTPDNIPVALPLAERLKLRTAEHAREEQEQVVRARMLESLVILDRMTATQAIVRSSGPPTEADLAAVCRGEQRARAVFQEIPLYSAMSELPAACIDALVNRVAELREALQCAYGDNPPRPGPGRLPEQTTEDRGRWVDALRWLYDIELPALRTEAVAMARSAVGRDELRAIVAVLLQSVVWRAARRLWLDMPPPAVQPSIASTPQTIQDLSPQPSAEEQRRSAAGKLRELARLLSVLRDTILGAFRSSVDGPYPSDRALSAVRERWLEAEHYLRLAGEPPPELPREVPTENDFIRAFHSLESYILAAVGRIEAQSESQMPAEAALAECAPEATEGDGAPEPRPTAGSEKSQAPSQPPLPPIPLRGWQALFAALNEPFEKQQFPNTPQNRDLVLSYNEMLAGPIKPPKGQGTQPEVEKGALMQWWTGPVHDYLTSRQEAKEQKAEATQLTVASTHKFGADGMVVPEIGGYVKKSRKKSGQRTD